MDGYVTVVWVFCIWHNTNVLYTYFIIYMISIMKYVDLFTMTMSSSFQSAYHCGIMLSNVCLKCLNWTESSRRSRGQTKHKEIFDVFWQCFNPLHFSTCDNSQNKSSSNIIPSNRYYLEKTKLNLFRDHWHVLTPLSHKFLWLTLNTRIRDKGSHRKKRLWLSYVILWSYMSSSWLTFTKYIYVSIHSWIRSLFMYSDIFSK